MKKKLATFEGSRQPGITQIMIYCKEWFVKIRPAVKQ